MTPRTEPTGGLIHACPGVASIVRVSLPKAERLTICEFEVNAMDGCPLGYVPEEPGRC